MFGVGTVLRLEEDAPSIVKRLKPTMNEYALFSPQFQGCSTQYSVLL